jgi:hypothetical protein
LDVVFKVQQLCLVVKGFFGIRVRTIPTICVKREVRGGILTKAVDFRIVVVNYAANVFMLGSF